MTEKSHVGTSRVVEAHGWLEHMQLSYAWQQWRPTPPLQWFVLPVALSKRLQEQVAPIATHAMTLHVHSSPVAG